MKLMHVVEPDFPEAIIDIVTTDRMEVRNYFTAQKIQIHATQYSLILNV